MTNSSRSLSFHFAILTVSLLGCVGAAPPNETDAGVDAAESPDAATPDAGSAVDAGIRVRRVHPLVHHDADLEWHQASGGPQHIRLNQSARRNGYLPAWTAKVDDPELQAEAGDNQLRYGTGSLAVAGPLIVGDTVFQSSRNGSYALDLYTGARRWATGALQSMWGSGVAYVDGALIGWERNAHVPAGPVAISATDGTPIWRRTDFEYTDASDVTAAGDIAYMGLATNAPGLPLSGSVIALDPPSGETIWRAETGKGATTPAIFGDLLVVADRGGEVVALDVHSGALRWRTPFPPTTPTWGTAEVVIAGDIAIARFGGTCCASAASLVALDAGSGRELWRRAGVIVQEPLIVAYGTLIARDSDFEFVQVDVQTGADADKFLLTARMNGVFSTIFDGLALASLSTDETVAVRYIALVDAFTGLQVGGSLVEASNSYGQSIACGRVFSLERTRDEGVVVRAYGDVTDPACLRTQIY